MTVFTSLKKVFKGHDYCETFRLGSNLANKKDFEPKALFGGKILLLDVDLGGLFYRHPTFSLNHSYKLTRDGPNLIHPDFFQT